MKACRLGSPRKPRPVAFRRASLSVHKRRKATWRASAVSPRSHALSVGWHAISSRSSIPNDRSSGSTSIPMRSLCSVTATTTNAPPCAMLNHGPFVSLSTQTGRPNGLVRNMIDSGGVRVRAANAKRASTRPNRKRSRSTSCLYWSCRRRSSAPSSSPSLNGSASSVLSSHQTVVGVMFAAVEPSTHTP